MWGRNLLSKGFDILCRSYSNRGIYTAVHRPHPVACGQHNNKKKAQHKIINLLKVVSFMTVIWFSSSTVYILSVNTVDDNIVSQDQKFGYVIKSKN